MSKPILSDLNLNNSARIKNVPNPVASSDAINRDYVDVGDFKKPVKCCSTGNLNLASMASATIDGYTMSVGDRFFAGDQIDTREQGIYIFNGVGAAATRAPDADTSEKVQQMKVCVQYGSVNAGTCWRIDNIAPITLGTTFLGIQSFASPTGVNPADEGTQGIARIATSAEALAGTNDQTIVTPKKLADAAIAYALLFG